MRAPNTYLVIAVAIAVLAAVGAWGYSTTRGNGIIVYQTPYRAEMDCLRYSTQSGRATMRIEVQNITKSPLRFRGYVFVTIRHDRHPYATARGQTPLVTIAPGATYDWRRLSRPILLHGSTRHLSSGGCGFYANPPHVPS